MVAWAERYAGDSGAKRQMSPPLGQPSMFCKVYEKWNTTMIDPLELSIEVWSQCHCTAHYIHSSSLQIIFRNPAHTKKSLELSF